MMMKKFLSAALALIMTLSLVACGGGGAEEPKNEGSATESASAYKLGGTGPLTGGAAIYGNAAKNGAQIAVDEINAMQRKRLCIPRH